MSTSADPAPTARIGIDAYSFVASIEEAASVEMLDRVRDLGADGLQTTIPAADDEARELFAGAAERALYLEPYVKVPVDWANDAALIESRAQSFRSVVRIASEHGVRNLHCSIGAGERFEDFARWPEYKLHVAATLAELAPELEAHGLRLNIENHGDFTSRELVELVERIGSRHVGIGLDTGNLLYFAEDVASAVERVAEFVGTVHLKDGLMLPHARGALRAVAAAGSGQIDFAHVIGVLCRANPDLNLTIEDHAGVLPVPFFERDWLAVLPELSAVDVASTAELAFAGGRRVRDHLAADPQAVEAVPWATRADARLRGAVKALREAASTALGS